MNATEAFLGEPEHWTRVRVELHDVHGLWGGQACFVWGTGRVVAQLAAVTQHEDRYAVTVPPGDIVRLVMALIETDFITLTFPARSLLPDEASPTITVINPAGQSARVSKPARDVHPGFDLVYQHLRQLVERARLGECLYQGPYDPHFVPAETA
jgi:hypothetical protein